MAGIAGATCVQRQGWRPRFERTSNKASLILCFRLSPHARTFSDCERSAPSLCALRTPRRLQSQYTLYSGSRLLTRKATSSAGCCRTQVHCVFMQAGAAAFGTFRTTIRRALRVDDLVRAVADELFRNTHTHTDAATVSNSPSVYLDRRCDRSLCSLRSTLCAEPMLPAPDVTHSISWPPPAHTAR